MADPKDDLARMRAELDQGREGLKEVAAPLWGFYSALTSEGFTAEQALALVVTWFTTILSGGGSEAGEA